MSKASKQRHCPALGHGISSAECGEKRQSQIICPADCSFNPFGPAHYDQLLALEKKIDDRTMQQLLAQPPDPVTFRQKLARAQYSGMLAIQTFYFWHLYYALGPDGLTFTRRWELAGWRDLKNDEQVMLRAKMQVRIALLEIHRVFADDRIEAVDLLSPHPEPMIFRDRALARTTNRFTIILTWICPLPHYWRLSGTANHVPELGQFPAPEIIREIVTHLGGPVTEPEMRRWLAEHLPHFVTALHAVSSARHQQMLAGIDAKWGAATYVLQAPFAQCRNWLDDLPDVSPDDLSPAEMDEGLAEARVWFEPEPKHPALTTTQGQIILGRVLLGQTQWRLEAMGAEKLSRLRSRFESHLGDRIRFVSERIEDLGGRLAAQEPAVDETLVPPRLLENPSQAVMASSRLPALPPGLPKAEAENALRQAMDRAFLEDHIPALDHRTPREAAQDPVLRPKLIQLIKQRVRGHDDRNLQTGRTDDINWLLKDLGLTEILFEAPPLRPLPPPPQRQAPPGPPPPPLPELPDLDWLDQDDWDEPIKVDPLRPPAPPLPPEPLTADEAFARTTATLARFKSIEEAEDELLASGSTLLDDLDVLTLDLLSESDFSLALPLILQTWFALVPFGCRAPEILYDHFAETLDANGIALAQAFQAPTPAQFKALLSQSPQPELLSMMVGLILGKPDPDIPELPFSPESKPVILALIKTIIDEVAAALRQP